MADLSQIDLDAPEPSSTDESHLNTSSIVEDYDYYDAEARHVKSEDLHLYFKQNWKDKVGTTGIVVISFFTIAWIMITAILAFSYTDKGREFLQGLIFYLF